MSMNPGLTSNDSILFKKLSDLQDKHIFTKQLGDGQIEMITRKNNLNGFYVYFHSNLHGTIKLSDKEFLQEIEEIQKL